ncbi:transporter substrate-binding domain-containing protein [Pseudoduganella sp. DS3]|uniref:Transporter substrate-binding domain-containing protein n=1 Tax=Pseudoduganella guangdongensis TaxID=2692179 RepID=A0A6N9HLF9_9BURK|nr:transporter substrate-binding domain-containing protein [Pseudoduganella guangdongensis]MYN04179.1 transporter substrate-binding domain-containing protein [Pseudoduganella guangdongensis]
MPRAMLTIAVVLALAAARAGAAPLNFCMEDIPQAPWTMPDGSGLNIELLKRVAKLTGEQFNYVARPWKRCEAETRSGIMDGMIGPSDNPRRRAFSRPPLKADGTQDPSRAMYHDHVDLYLRVDSGASWDGKNLHNPRKMVVAQRGYYIVEILQARGQTVIDTAKAAEDGLRLLAAGSADVAVLMGRDAEALLRDDPRYLGKVVLAKQPFASFDFHLMVGRKAYDKDPKRFEAIWNAIAKVRATTEYQRLEQSQVRQHDHD